MASWASIAREGHKKSLGLTNKQIDENQSLPFMFEFLKEYLLLKNIHNISNISEIGVYNINVLLNLKKFIFDYLESYTNYDIAIYVKNNTDIIKNLIIELINEYQPFYISKYLKKYYTTETYFYYRILRIKKENLLSIFNFKYLNDYMDLEIKKGFISSYSGNENYEYFFEIDKEESTKFTKEKFLKEGVFKIYFDFSNGEKDKLLREFPYKSKKHSIILNKDLKIRYVRPGFIKYEWLSLRHYFSLYSFELNNIDNDIEKKDNWIKLNVFIQKLINKIAIPLLKANLP